MATCGVQEFTFKMNIYIYFAMQIHINADLIVEYITNNINHNIPQ